MSRKYVNSIVIENNYVKKKYNKNILEIYDILQTTNFNNYPKIIDYDDKFIFFEYLENKKYYEKIKGESLIKLVAKLHKETSYYIDVSKNKYKSIYNCLYGNIMHLKKYYLNVINNVEDEMFMRPSYYLFARNYSLIQNNLVLAEQNLKKWYKLIENKECQRVCVIHNNLSLNHFIKSENDYLISFDGALVDTPVLELYKFYKCEGYKLNFKELFNIYNSIVNLEKEDLLLLKILLLIPNKIVFNDNEYVNVIEIKNIFNVISKSVDIINENN